MSRRKARELAFKVIFQVDQVDANPQKAFKYLIEEAGLSENEAGFSWELIEGCLEKLADIDQKISRYSKAWEINRMSSVDRNIMRLASFEILYLQNAQPVVAIDEAIEISKRFGDESSASFVNAILDKIMGEKE